VVNADAVGQFQFHPRPHAEARSVAQFQSIEQRAQARLLASRLPQAAQDPLQALRAIWHQIVAPGDLLGQPTALFAREKRNEQRGRVVLRVADVRQAPGRCSRPPGSGINPRTFIHLVRRLRYSQTKSLDAGKDAIGGL
jgi:hypothetical protein